MITLICARWRTKNDTFGWQNLPKTTPSTCELVERTLQCWNVGNWQFSMQQSDITASRCSLYLGSLEVVLARAPLRSRPWTPSKMNCPDISLCPTFCMCRWRVAGVSGGGVPSGVRQACVRACVYVRAYVNVHVHGKMNVHEKTMVSTTTNNYSLLWF